VRARTHLAPLVAEIRRHRPDLRFQAVEVEALGDRPWIGDLLAVTRALLQRADRVHWLALLRSPLVGLTLADLCVLAEDDHQSTLWRLLVDTDRIGRLSEDGRRRVAHLTSVFDEAFAAQGRIPLARWVEGVWLLLDGPATLPDRSAVEDCEACLTLLAELDQSGRFDPDRLEAEVGRLYAAPDPQADESLRLMTIHKSKGLEFDTVILPGLHRTVKGSDPQMLLWDEVVVPGGAPQLLVAPMPPRGIGRAATAGGPSAYDYLKDLERRRSRNEDLRVLYVAATRARRTLHLVGTLVAGESGAPGASCGTASTSGARAKPPPNTPLSDLWGALAPMLGSWPDGATKPEEAARAATDADSFSPPLSRLKFARRPSLLSARSATPVPPASVEATAGDADESSALFGTLAHRYLQIIADSDEGQPPWGRLRIESAQAAMVWWLEQRGARDAAALARRLVGVLAAVVESDRGRWVLARRKSASAELALAANGRISVIDRSFVDNGVRWIIDYKTTPTGGLDAAAVGRLAESHRPQLEAYAALFADGALPVRLAVFFIDGLQWIELPYGIAKGATK
jgi:ATP-dependent exoDNAse (exonuclease V) beta subunit